MFQALARIAALATVIAGATPQTARAQAATDDSSAAPRVNLNKWESGLDLKYGQVLDEGTPVLSAQWLRRFLTGTRLGVSLSALPTSVARKETDGSRTRANMLSGGLVVEQVLWEDAPFRISVGVGAGQGRLYVRNELQGRANVFDQPDFRYVEGSLNAYFYNFRHLDLGAMAGFRTSKLEDGSPAEDADVGGIALGLSFRHII